GWSGVKTCGHAGPGARHSSLFGAGGRRSVPALSLSGGQLFHRFQATAFEMQVEADRARARLEVELENLALQPRVAGPDGAGAHPASRNHLLEFLPDLRTERRAVHRFPGPFPSDVGRNHPFVDL